MQNFIAPTKYMLLALLLLLSIPACAQNENVPDTGFHYFKNASVKAQTQYYSRQPGNDLVFEYEVRNKGREEIVDDEWVMRLVWQVPANTKKFSLKGEELKKAKANYLVGCFCLGRGYYGIVDGEISGIRIKKDLWQVDGTIRFTSSDGKDHEISFSGNFSPAVAEVQE